jgi:long-chain fatty acid transport protein
MDSMADYGLLIPGSPDGKNRLQGRGEAWGYNLGVLYKANQKHSVAATYKSSYKIDYSGKFRLTGIPVPLGALLGIGSSYTSAVESSMEFPSVVVLGYAYRPTEKLKLEVNLDWTNWDIFDSVVMKIDAPLVGLVPATITQRYDLKDTIAYKLGLEYALSENLDLRAGYIYNENATPERTWRPSLPDTNTQFITTGLGWHKGQISVDGAIQIIFYEDRRIANNVDNNEGLSSSSIDGKYENIATGFSLSVTYQF